MALWSSAVTSLVKHPHSAICSKSISVPQVSHLLIRQDHIAVSELDSYTDQWLEEDTPIFVHPKDPFKRIDILHCSRPLRVSLNNTVIATPPFNLQLYETGLRVRYYIPLSSIDTSILRPSGTKTQCPYKGTAEYYDVVVGSETYKDAVWYYTQPTVECAAIAGLCCFYNEKVDMKIQNGDDWQEA